MNICMNKNILSNIPNEESELGEFDTHNILKVRIEENIKNLPKGLV